MKKPEPKPAEPADVKKRFRALFDKINEDGGAKAKESDVEALRGMMREHSDLKLHREIPGPGQASIDYLLQMRMAGAAMSEAWRERVEEIRRGLGFEGASYAEKMLIDHAALCWLQHAFISFNYSRVLSQGATVAQGHLLDKRVSAAQRRVTRSLTELARLRALTAAARYATARAEAAEGPKAEERTGPRALSA